MNFTSETLKIDSLKSSPSEGIKTKETIKEMNTEIAHFMKHNVNAVKCFVILNDLGHKDIVGTLDISDFLETHFECDPLGDGCLDDLQMDKWLFLELHQDFLYKQNLNDERLNIVLLELSEQFDRRTGDFIYQEKE